MIKITKTTQKDAEELHNLHLTSFWEPDNILEDPNDNYSISDEKEEIKNTDIYMKATIDSQIAGYLKIIRGKFNKNHHVGKIELYILPEFRRKGVGTKLLQSGIKYAKKEKVKRLELEVWSNNRPAKKLYSKFRFKKEGLKSRAYKIGSRYVDGIIMSKWLNQ